MKRFLVVFLLLSCTVALGQKKKPGTAATDPWPGTYKLDAAQSKTGGPAPQQETVTVTSANKDSIKYTISGKDPQGNSYTMNFDGKVGTASPQMAEGKEIAQDHLPDALFASVHFTGPRRRRINQYRHRHSGKRRQDHHRPRT